MNLGLIPARGGSRELLGKNTRLLDDVPLVAHSIRSARESGVFDEIHVSTEDGEVREIALAHGAVVIPRPASLARDETPMFPVIEHAIEWLRAREGELPDHTFLLEPTSPLRGAEDIRTTAAILARGGCDSVMGVFRSDDPPQWALRPDSDGFLRPAGSREEYHTRRQELAATYFPGPIFAARTPALLEQRSFLTARTRFFVVPRERAVDIDTEMDLRFAEFLLARSREAEALPQRSAGRS